MVMISLKFDPYFLVELYQVVANALALTKIL